MTVQIEIGGRLVRVSIERAGPDNRYRFMIDGQAVDVGAVGLEPGTWSLVLQDGSQHIVGVSGRLASGYTVHLPSGDVAVNLVDRGRRSSRGRVRTQEGTGSGQVAAPMPGKVVRVLVTVGQSVQAGEGIVVIEAMKMENELRAARAGVVRQVAARPGLSVEAGAVLAVID
ncbi:MAG: biotin/lipoyl-containing protein [Vicinamibacterales bacterium]